MSYGNDHDRHDHDYDYAGKHHRHHDLAEETVGVREDLGRAEARIYELEGRVDALEALVSNMPEGSQR